MMKSVPAFVLGAITAVLASDCGMSPVAPNPGPLNLSGTWNGTGSDSQGRELLTWVLAQTGNTLSGTAITRAVDVTDGTCASCHKNKMGSLSGTVLGTTLSVTMFFPTGGDVPTPMCSVTIDATASGITNGRIAATYSGVDSCEGPFTDGAFTMDRQP